MPPYPAHPTVELDLLYSVDLSYSKGIFHSLLIANNQPPKVTRFDMKLQTFFTLGLPLAIAHHPPSPSYQTLPSLRDQATLVNNWTSIRRATISSILTENNVSAWLISQREYAEDTIFWPMSWAYQFSARRRTTSLFLANGESYEWIDNTEDLWAELNKVLRKENPKTIAIDAHGELAFAGGLHAGERDVIEANLDAKLETDLS